MKTADTIYEHMREVHGGIYGDAEEEEEEEEADC
jgi:hypothetical protein